MPHAPVGSRTRTRRLARACAVALVTGATVAAPLGTIPSADAAYGTRPVIALHVDFYGVAMSPNGDHSKDKARIRFTLAKRSDVVVKVRRTNGTGTLVYPTVVYKKRLGKLTRGDHTWTWNGRNLDGKVVRDGRYKAVLVADQVAVDGKKQTVGTAVYVDTVFDVPWAPRRTASTVYPTTPGRERDFIGLTLGSDPSDPRTALGKVVATLKDADGNVVWRRRPFEYHDSPYEQSMPLAFRGLDVTGTYPLPAGTYRLRYTVWDMAGNLGGAKAVTVHVSDKPLVEATGSVVVPPTGSWDATALPSDAPARAGRASMLGGDDPQPLPCGTVVPSEVYTEPGAMSFRSSDACGGTFMQPSLAAAGGAVDLTRTLTPEVAPRGLATSWVSMRGRPTVDGETDTARLYQGPLSYFYDLPGGYASPAPVAEETVTTTQPNGYPFEAPYFAGYVRAVNWFIATVGVDSYDVAAVTVHYTYLTPQP